jgi:hypothetical protein
MELQAAIAEFRRVIDSAQAFSEEAIIAFEKNDLMQAKIWMNAFADIIGQARNILERLETPEHPAILKPKPEPSDSMVLPKTAEGTR